MGRFEYKKIIIFSLVCLGLVFVANLALAQTTDVTGLGYAQGAGLGTQDIRITIANIIRVFMGILGVVAIAIILYGGVLYMTSNGELEKIKRAKQLLTGAVIGLVIVLSAFTIASFIISSIQNAAGPGGGGEVTGPVTPGNPPPPPQGFCNDPDTSSAAPFICELSPIQANRGDFVTIKGANFLVKNSSGGYLPFASATHKVILVRSGETQEYQAVISSCNTGFSWNASQLVFEVPADLPFTEGQSNTYNVYVVNPNGSSKDKPIGGLLPTNKLELLAGEPGPGIACIVPDSGKKNDVINVYGKRFGANQGTSALKFNNNISATVTTWSEINLKTTVPGAAQSGEVKATVNNVASNGYYFTVTCAANSDCDSGCCADTSFGKSCSPVNYCLPGPGQACNANTAVGAACQPTECQIGSVCDACVCRYAQTGDSCDNDTVAPGCQLDNTKCPADNICNTTTCRCEETMVITAVTPNDGAAGNYITISGKGFGQGGVGNSVLVNSDFEDSNIKAWNTNVNAAVLPGVFNISNQTAFAGAKSLSIDTSTISSVVGDPKYMYYFSFVYPTNYIRPKLQADGRYLVSLKIKGTVDTPTAFKFFAVTGDLSAYSKVTLKSPAWFPAWNTDNCNDLPSPYGNCPNQPANFAYCCRWARSAIPQTSPWQTKDLFTIPIGTYQDWTTFQAVFIYDQDMQSWVNSNGYSVLFGFWAYVAATPTKGLKVFIDNLDIKKIDNIGQVVFCGQDNVCGGNGASDDKIAKLPFEVNTSCGVEDAWKNDQIVVVAPDAGTDGPIQVAGTSGSKDQTNLPPGLPISNFDFNDIKRPSLCGLIPNSGSFSTKIKAYGSAFGTTKGDVFINDPANNKIFDNKSSWLWQDTSISNLYIPNLQVGGYSAAVKVGTQISNPMTFNIVPVANAPTIDRIEPIQGQPGQYVTIYGSNFGNQPGLVKFSNAETNKDNWASADLSFPTQCQSDYWHDSYIVVKVPSGLTLTQHDISVKAGGIFSAVSANTKFGACDAGSGTCPLTPGICAIVPSQGPVGLSGVTIYGDNFGATQGTNGKVKFYNGVEAGDLSANWTNNQIGIGNLTQSTSSSIVIPIGASTGPVTITDNNSNLSNSLKFNVSDCRVDNTVCASDQKCCGTGVCQATCPVSVVNNCTYQWSFTTGQRVAYFGPPYVIENNDCATDLQSPSPWISSSDNCPNTLISAKFRQPIQTGEADADILTSTLIQDNIKVFACNTAALFDSAQCSQTAIGISKIEFTSPRTVNGSQVASQIVIYPAATLSVNTWYKVVLKSDPQNNLGIKTEAGIYLDGNKDGLDGGDYSWNFRVNSSGAACVVDKITVTPPAAKLSLLTETQAYSAYPVSGNCNILNPGAYTWAWSKKYSDGFAEAAETLDANHGVALLNQISTFGYKQLATPKKQGLVYVAAAIPDLNKIDDNNQLVVDLNLPIIDSFYPHDGINQPEVNSYVTIDGRNFGKTQGTNKVLFGEVEAPLATCDDAWTDTRIKVVVPKVAAITSDINKTYALALAGSSPEIIMDYNFDDDSDVIVTDPAGQHQGEINSGIKVDSPFNKALEFNGTNTLVKVSGALNISSGSIEVWFKPDQNQGGTIFSVTNANSADDFSISYSPSNSSAIKVNQWNYLVYTYNSVTQHKEIYLNGIRVTGLNSGITVSGNFVGTANTSLTLGAKNTGVFSSYFKGQLDDFRIYNKALSSQDIWKNFGLQPGQIVLLSFEENGAEVLDSSANNFGGLVISNQAVSFRTDEGKFGKAITFDNNNHINIINDPSLVFDDQISIEGWFKIDSVAGLNNNIIFQANNISLGLDNGNIRFEANIGGGVKYAQLPLIMTGANKNIALNVWNYFAGVYDGQKIKIYFNSQEAEYATSGKINQQADFNSACIGGCGNNFKGTLDSFALYNMALTPAKINSRLGAKDNSFIKVVTSFGEATTTETYKYSENIYPFLCALKPNSGNEGTSVTVSGDNLGKSNKTSYQGKEYGLGSYLKFAGAPISLLTDAGIKSWANDSLNYINPFKDLATSVINVFVAIDPYSEPYNDKENIGQYVAGDEFADINPAPNGDGVYNKVDYSVYGQTGSQTELISNQLEFYQSPVITSLSPDNGPVKQWVTIYGYNFGEVPGQVIFYNNTIGQVIGCPDAVWHDTYIITSVPEGALTGELKIKTAKLLDSNGKLFTVNTKPVGPGLCALQDLNGVPKTVGANSEGIQAIGARFDGQQGLNNLVFSDNQNAEITTPANWTDTKIISTIPLNAKSGSVFVNKRVVVGQKCVGFAIASWCPSNKYDLIYQDVPSNSLPMQLAACGSPILELEARDKGFPLETFTKNADGSKQVTDKINLSNMATDGTYLYTMVEASGISGSTVYGASEGDNFLTIYKIGTGYNGTEIGRLYKKYQTSGKYYLPGKDTSFDIALPYPAQFSLIYTPNGLFVGQQYHALRRTWLATTDPLYTKEFWGIAKVRFIEATGTYDWIFQEIPQGLNAYTTYWLNSSGKNYNWNYSFFILKSTGNNILVPSYDTTGYTIQVLDNNWNLIKTVYIKNAEITTGPWAYSPSVFKSTFPMGIADDQNFYFTANQVVNSVNWRSGTWTAFYPAWITYTKELNGAYDWINNKYWFGSIREDVPITWRPVNSYYFNVVPYDPAHPVSHHNRIYRYSNCPLAVSGYCRADSDCTRGGLCTQSKCQNGQCTPQITDVNPLSGPIGSWVTISGCNFGCDPGQVYFTGNTTAGAKGLQLADPICNAGSWSCAANNTKDQVLIEAPNRYTSDVTDDALTGPVKLVTSAGLIDSSDDLTANGIFTVNQNPLGAQICKLIPDYGNRGLKVRIYGENFGDAPEATDSVTFEPTADTIAEPFLDYGSDKLPDLSEPNYNPTSNQDPNGDDFSPVNPSGTEGNGHYDTDEPYIDINGDGNYNNDLSKNSYSSNITTFVNSTALASCPADGWDNKNICVAVPTNAAGQGTGSETALDNIAIVKGSSTSNNKQFEVTFGSCGNQKLEADKGEMCDGTQLATLTSDELVSICRILFSPLYPDEQIATCTQACNSNCQSTFCVGGTCKTAQTLCGNGTIQHFIKGTVNYNEQCDGTDLGGATCSQYGKPDTCDISCTNTCQLLICDANGANCQTASTSCGDGVIQSTEQCDGSNLNGKTCADIVSGSSGTLSCNAAATANACQFNTTGCTATSANAQSLSVESTSPVDTSASTSSLVCRNAKINIYFDKIVNQDKVTTGNFILQTCPTGMVTFAPEAGLIKSVWNYFSNIFEKLVGVKKDVLAQATCSTVNNYTLELTNTNKSKVSIVPTGLLDPDQVYVVQIRGGLDGIVSSEGGILNPVNSPKHIGTAPDYVFEFKTLGTSTDPKSGICSADWIDVNVYRTAAITTGELRNNDLFMCAGTDCKLLTDWDQDSSRAGNQHIYKATALYNNSIELQASFQWSKSDTSDPQRAISISNSDDTAPDDYIVKNETGYVSATPGSLKEAVAKLVVEAQALASSSAPVQRDFNVYILLCANPWPGIDEKFPISSIINAYNFQTYYCRDAGRPNDTSDDLPAARWLAPKEDRLTILQNTDFEFGNLTYWTDLTGTAFNSQPVFRDVPKERGGVSSYIQGAWWLNTYERYRGQSWESVRVVQGNTPVGILQSSAFKIEGKELKFRLGGDNNPWPAAVSSVVNFNDSNDPNYDQISGVTAAVLFYRENNTSGPFSYALSVTGDGSQVMTDKTWDVSTYEGKTGIIYIYDNNSSGFISFDDLRQYDSNNVEIPIRF